MKKHQILYKEQVKPGSPPEKHWFRANKKYINYGLDLGILVTFILMFSTGLLKFINLYIHTSELTTIAGFLSTLHDWSGLILGVLVLVHLLLHIKWLGRMTKNITKLKWERKTLNYLIDLGLLVSVLLVFITGILKFPSLPFNREILYANSAILLLLHDWSGIFLGILSIIHVVLHWKWITAMTKRIFGRTNIKQALKYSFWIGLIIMGFIFIPMFISNSPLTQNSGEEVIIRDIGTFKFNPEEIQSIRPEIFAPGHYSLFDILVDLDDRGEINMEYHYEPTMDTYIIDSINGLPDWWYGAYYDGGWRETSVFRMDLYPYKPKMFIEVFQRLPSTINAIYNTFEEEVVRKNNNNGNVLIPAVVIRTPTEVLSFYNVSVTAHNLRNDTLQQDVITAIDVIMSLGDQGSIRYRLNWYETIGFAEVKNYYVDEINEHASYARCGFVYEVGDYNYYGFIGNHIHIPADIRVLTSPEYEEWFWICI